MSKFLKSMLIFISCQMFITISSGILVYEYEHHRDQVDKPLVSDKIVNEPIEFSVETVPEHHIIVQEDTIRPSSNYFY